MSHILNSLAATVERPTVANTRAPRQAQFAAPRTAVGRFFRRAHYFIWLNYCNTVTDAKGTCSVSSLLRSRRMARRHTPTKVTTDFTYSLIRPRIGGDLESMAQTIVAASE